ncbi:MAG: C39 family peptidase [Melioribacteraceae bacterium]|nr:C39 family peptidase [Melioribacteraceae bacterium]
MKLVKLIYSFAFLYTFISLHAFTYPDQHYVLYADSIYARIESSENIKLSDDGKSIHLNDNALEGYLIVAPFTSASPYNRGLPSWNGTGVAYRSSFKVQMRFPYGSGWSPWLTAGFWKDNIWSTYGSTSYNEGYIDYDYVKLDNYYNTWQFKVILKRKALTDQSPSIKKLSFFISDSRTEDSIDHANLLNDKPGEIFIPTTFIYQYAVDDDIGGSICSPTTVSMILKSYSIEVDVLQFAKDTKDPYYGIFGIWPRVVQNASEYGLDGAVTRYRNWSQAREVLANGGRIAMSVGRPLYSGHLIMLAGFTSNGSPIVHDPARTDGYQHVFSKSDLGHSWFDKGGISYSFYPMESPTGTENESIELPAEFVLHQNYPNPFNPATTIEYEIPVADVHRDKPLQVTIKIYDIIGNEIATLANESRPPGRHTVHFDTSSLNQVLASGTYLLVMRSGGFIQTRKMLYLK